MSTGSAGSAVVTGAGRGLGREIAGLLGARGSAVHVTDLDGEAAAATALGRWPPFPAGAGCRCDCSTPCPVSPCGWLRRCIDWPDGSSGDTRTS